MSKIVEYVTHSQLMHYFTSNELFSSQQYSFQANRSTELAVLELVDRNIYNMNKNLTPINIYNMNKNLTPINIYYVDIYKPIILSFFMGLVGGLCS